MAEGSIYFSVNEHVTNDNLPMGWSFNTGFNVHVLALD